MAKPKKITSKEVVVSETPATIATPDIKDMPELVTIVGTDASKNLKTGKEYPGTHRILAQNLIKKGFATLKT